MTNSDEGSIEVKKLQFNNETKDRVKGSEYEYGTNWPVVYILNNDEEAYVGETVDVSVRAGQHWQHEEKRIFDQMHIISDDDFNKSVILDLEAYLIKYMSSDGRFLLQNGNNGLSEHNYYNREEYESRFEEVWRKLKNEGLVRNTIEDIENSDLFKYSPYKALTAEQESTLIEILNILKDDVKNGTESTVLVTGGAGTGKTVLAVFLMKLLAEVNEKVPYSDPEEMDEIDVLADEIGKLKIGLVIPMQSLRSTITKVFESIKGLSPEMVVKPEDVPYNKYDMLIVDEAHRLRQRKALAHYPRFDACNDALGLGKDGTELDWIIKCSKMQVLFYDSGQSVKPSDIDGGYISDTVKKRNYRECTLESQLRCLGGNDYINYITYILKHGGPAKPKIFPGYDFKMFDDIEEMFSVIRQKNDEEGLCRVAAGYAWKWVTKDKANRDKGMHDICLQGHEYDWNSTATDWINSKNSINEIGCIHTVQGYDLNYIGVIFGNEIKYDKTQGGIIVDRSEYYDRIGKTALKDDDELRDYIINIYVTLMTRGIKGAYVYVCDDGLREYMGQYILDIEK